MNIPMNAYFYLLIFIFCLYLIAPKLVNDHNNKKTKQYYVLGVIVLMSFHALKDPLLYPDTTGYMDLFQTGYLEGNYEINIGYEILNKTITLFSKNFNFYSFVLAIIFVSCNSVFLIKNTKKPLLALFLYTIVAYFPSFWLWRQYMAIIFVLFAYNYIIEQNLKSYLFYMLIATSMHTTAIIVLPLYWVYKVRMNDRRFVFLILAVFFVIVTFKVLAGALAGISEYYSHYLDSDAESTTGRLLLKVYLVLLMLFTYRKHLFDKGWSYLLFLCALMNVIIYAGGSGIFGIFRLRAYFDVSEILGIPFILAYAHNLGKFKRYLIKTASFVYVIVLIITVYSFLQSENFQYGYHTFMF